MLFSMVQYMFCVWVGMMFRMTHAHQVQELDFARSRVSSPSWTVLDHTVLCIWSASCHGLGLDTLSVGPYYNWIWLDSSLVKPSIPFQFFFYDWVLMLQFIQLPSFIVKYGCIDSKLLCMPKTIIYYSMRPPLRLAWEWGKSSWALVSTEHLHIVIKSRHWVQINNKIFRFQIKFTYIRR